MAQSGSEPIGSMGTDTPIAVLSEPAQAALRLLPAAVRARSPTRRSTPIREELVTAVGVDDRAASRTCSTR
jgi:hypothetical protein